MKRLDSSLKIKNINVEIDISKLKVIKGVVLSNDSNDNICVIDIPTEKILFNNIKEYEEKLLAEIVRVKELNYEAEELFNIINKEIFDNKLIIQEG